MPFYTEEQWIFIEKALEEAFDESAEELNDADFRESNS